MGKNDFDIDFDFEKEYGFDPRELLGDEEYDDDKGLSDETPEHTVQENTANDDSFDMDDELNLDDFLNMSEDAAEEAEEAYEEESVDVPDFFDDEEDDVQVYVPQQTENAAAEAVQYAEDEDSDYEQEDVLFEDEPEDEDDEESAPEEPQRQRKERKPIKMPQINLPKITMPKLKTPNIFTKFYDLYFAPVLDKSMLQEPQDPNNPRRRRRKSKAQIFKEVYLPPIIICVSLILVLSFTIGSVSNLIEQKRIEASTEQDTQKETQNAAALEEQRYQQTMEKAEELASAYYYKEAIEALDAFGDMSKYPDMQAKRAEYVNTQNQLVEHKDISTIPNLSFHVLMVDPARAFAKEDLGGKYNRNFVSTTEFAKILEQLYANGYVLVDFDSVTGSNTDATGADMFFPNSIYLPAGKKPIMLTETLVNYFAYMIDGNKDGVADAQGAGFASKLVVEGDTVKAEYVDASGQTLVGDFDFVPILESFIAQHPDFSYQGARATLAVTGYEGVFGYRTNTSYIATKGNDYYNNEVAGAKAVAAKLRELGYTIACFTYNNEDYGKFTANQIQADLQQWTQQITPVLGDVDTLVYAQASDLQDYNSNAFQVLYTSGFRYFVGFSSQQPWAEINTNYVRQKRLMVTGNAMAWKTSQFNGMFDCASILDVNLRGNVPN